MKNASITLAALAVVSLASVPSADAASIWINELHYDNTGGDVDEFVEVAGLAGTNLSDYSLVLYNGSNGSAYSTTALSGILSNQLSGFGALAISFPADGIQNGGPDGLALVSTDPIIEVLQFLSYEGAFTAVNGPAAGMTSTAIGVSELSSTPVGCSLQLVGHGSASSDFVWALPAAESRGLLNYGQTFPRPTSAVPDSGITALLLLTALTPMTVVAHRRRTQGGAG